MSDNHRFSPTLNYFAVTEMVGDGYAKIRILDKNKLEIATTKLFYISTGMHSFSRFIWNEDESKFALTYGYYSHASGYSMEYRLVVVETKTGEFLSCKDNVTAEIADCSWLSYFKPSTIFINKDVVATLTVPLTTYNSLYKTTIQITDTSKKPSMYIDKMEIDNGRFINKMYFLKEKQFLVNVDSYINRRLIVLDVEGKKELCRVDLNPDDYGTYAEVSSEKNIFAVITPNKKVRLYNFKCQEQFSKELVGEGNLKSSIDPNGNLTFYYWGDSVLNTLDLSNYSLKKEDLAENIYGIKWNKKGQRLVLFGEPNIVNSLILKAASFINGMMTNITESSGHFQHNETYWGPIDSNSFFLLKEFAIREDEIHIYKWK